MKVYNTTTLADKYVRVSKVERAGDALQSILKIKKLMVVEGGYKPSSNFRVPWLKVSPTIPSNARPAVREMCVSGAQREVNNVNLVPVMEVEVHRQYRSWRESAKRELSDYTSQGREKMHKNNFRVSLPRCRAVRSWG